MNHRPDHATTCNHQAEGALECSVEVQPISGADLRRGRYVRYDGHGDIIPLYRNCQWLLYFDWLLRFWVYFDTIPHSVAWLSCAGFVFGEALYVLGTFAGDDIHTVRNTPGNCMRDRFDWLVTFTYFLGDLLWQPAVFCMLFDAMNHDFEAEYEEWYLSGQHKSKPRYRIFSFFWWSLEWWGAQCYFWAVVAYNTSSIATIIADCIYIQPSVASGVTIYPRIAGGILFMFAGAFYSMVFIHPWLIPSIFLPYRREDWRSLTWWAMWTHWWGGVSFFMIGVCLYWYSPTKQDLGIVAYSIVNSIGFGLGSLLFHIGGLMMLAEQSSKRCQPSVAKVIPSLAEPVKQAGPHAAAERT